MNHAESGSKELPSRDIADARDHGDQNTDRNAGKRDDAATGIALGPDTEEHQQEREHDCGVAENFSLVVSDPRYRECCALPS